MRNPKSLIVAALRRRPRSSKQIAEATGIPLAEVSTICKRHPRCFVRTNPDVPPTRLAPTVWRLRRKADGPLPEAQEPKDCRHCSKAKASRPRGLCWSCFYTPEIRALYPPTSKHGARGYGLGASTGAPDAPTLCPPGTAAKVAVLQERAKLRQRLDHPADARFEGDPRPVEWLAERAVPA